MRELVGALPVGFPDVEFRDSSGFTALVPRDRLRPDAERRRPSIDEFRDKGSGVLRLARVGVGGSLGGKAGKTDRREVVPVVAIESSLALLAGREDVRLGTKLAEEGEDKLVGIGGTTCGGICRLVRARSFSLSLWSWRKLANDAWKSSTTSKSRSRPNDDPLGGSVGSELAGPSFGSGNVGCRAGTDGVGKRDG